MHKSIALLSKGVASPPSRKFWQIGHNCEQRFTHVTRIEIFHWHLCYDLLKLAQMDGSAIFVLHTITHSLYCYNWTFHCFLLLTPDIFAPFVFVCFIWKLWSTMIHTQLKSTYKNTVTRQEEFLGFQFG